jgi:integrase
MNRIGDIPIRQVTGRHIGDFSHFLLNERKPTITLRTLDKKLNAINALFSQAVVDSDWDKKDDFPTVGHFRFKKKRRAHTKSAENSYRAFTDNELGKVFEPASFLREATSPHLYWLPLLSCLSGGRLNELAQLLTNDVRQHDGVWVLHINGDGHPKKRVKTDSGNRMIPLHPKLIELGFLDYVELVKTFDADAFEFPGLLFPYLTHSEKNGFGGASSTWFGRYLNRVELSDPLLVFHSLRKTFNQALINRQIHVEHRSRLLGHAFESVNTEVYGTDLPLQQVLTDFIAPIEAPTVRVALLRKSAAEFRGMLTRLSAKHLRAVERQRVLNSRKIGYIARPRARLSPK